MHGQLQRGVGSPVGVWQRRQWFCAQPVQHGGVQVFIVDVRADKAAIKSAVSRLYDIQTKKINTLIRPDGQKKAYVRLTPDYDALDVANKVRGMFKYRGQPSMLHQWLAPSQSPWTWRDVHVCCAGRMLWPAVTLTVAAPWPLSTCRSASS